MSALRGLRDRFEATAGGLSPVFWAIWWGTLVNRLASFVGVFLSLYLVQVRGLDAAAAGRIVALFGLGGLVAAPVAGVLADRVGRKATMLAGLGLGALSTASIAFAREPALLAVLVFCTGGLGQFYFPASTAAIADVVPTADRPRAFGLVYWAMNLGLAVGFTMGGALAGQGLVTLFLAEATATLCCAALVAVRVPETRATGLTPEPVLPGLLRVFRDGPFVVFLGLHVAGLVIFTQFQLALPLDMAAHGVGPSGFALLMAANCAGVVLLQPWLSPLLRRFDGAHLLACSVLLFAVGYGLNAVSASLPMYLLGAAFWTVGEVVGFPVAATIVADLAPASLRGRYQGAFSMIWALGMTLSPAIGGEVTARFGARTLWLGCLVAGIAVAGLHLLLAGPRRRRLLAVAAAQEQVT